MVGQVGADATRAVARQARARSEARLRALSDVGRAGVGLPKKQATKNILQAAMRACEADAASLGVWMPERQVLRAVLNVGDLAPWEEEEPEDEVYEADQSTWLAGMAEGVLGAVLSLGDITISADDRQYLEELEKESSISVPLLYAGEWWGELFVARSDDRPAFVAGDLDWVSAVAAQVSAALESVDHAASVEQLAQTDSMTGLANRRALDRWLDDAMVQWRDHQVPMGLAVVDLNGLKRINDDQGHDAGDRVLRQLAHILFDASRGFQHSLVARLGGDEFCVAVSGNDAEQLVDAATAACQAGWDLLPHGLACGVVVTSDAVGPVEQPGRLLRLADAAQYRAKRLQSRIPIVSGMPLPDEFAVSLSDDEDEVVSDRRLFRGRDASSLGQLTDAALRALDQAGDEAPRTRLGLVADLFTHHIDGLGWWLSLRAQGAETLRTVDFSLYRRPPGLGADDVGVEASGEFALGTYPQTRQALAGGSYLVTSSDITADPAELAILDGMGATAVVAAGGVDEHSDSWLIEVFMDELSSSTQEIAGLLRLLVLAAVHPVSSD
ncbi:MAG: GGDEF domain-containing protein [Actinomycetes bacterium]